MRPLIAVAAAVLLLAGCSSSRDDNGLTKVDWSRYSHSIHTHIDQARAGRDCDTLQLAFDTADRVGKNGSNADLMGYIGDSMTAAGCNGGKPRALDVDGCYVPADQRTSGQRDYAAFMDC